jgi:type IV pilus assembly protein PilA
MIFDKRGFSLIELLIVVVVIGILAATAIPKFQKIQARAKGSGVGEGAFQPLRPVQ